MPWSGLPTTLVCCSSSIRSVSRFSPSFVRISCLFSSGSRHHSLCQTTYDEGFVQFGHPFFWPLTHSLGLVYLRVCPNKPWTIHRMSRFHFWLVLYDRVSHIHNRNQIAYHIWCLPISHYTVNSFTKIQLTEVSLNPQRLLNVDNFY